MRVRNNDALRGENLQYLFTILFILGFIAFFVFLLLMILSMRKHNRLPIRHVMLTAACFAIASIGMYGILASTTNPIRLGTDQTADTKMNTFEANNDDLGQTGLFNMTTDEFKNKFNSIVGKYRLNGLSITALNVKESPEQDTKTFEYYFNDELRMVGVLNSEQKVQDVMLYETGDVSKPTGGILLTAIATLILTTNNEYTYNDAQDVIEDIGLLDHDASQSEFDGATVRNELEYRFIIQDNISTFGIKPVN